MSRFDEIKIGEVAEISHTVTESDLKRFVELTGDNNRLHIDSEYAAQTSFKKPVAHGMLGASFISTVIGTKLPGDGALWFSQNLEFRLPVRVGDRLTVRVQVLKKSGRMKVVELQTDIFNQHRQKVTTGVAKVKLIETEVKSSEQPRLERRIALVIGGSGGIGAAVCRILAQDNFDVAVHYFINQRQAQRLAEEISALGKRSVALAADISVASEVTDLVEQVTHRLGPISVIVNCATAKIVPVKFDDLCWDDIQDQATVAIRGAYNIAKAIVPKMEQAGYGKLIYIASQAIETPSVEWLPYITAKSALVGFSRALAIELAPKGIRVNLVSPGMTETEQIADVPEKTRLLTAARTPLRRLARPDDVAGAVAFLASERSDFLTGETIRVNGGQVML